MPTKSKSTAAPLSEDAIRQRTYLLWEADGRPDGMADHYWQKASEPAPDISARPKAKAMAAKTATALKAQKGKSVNPAETTPPGAKAKTSAKPKSKAAAAKVDAPAVKAKPAARAPAKKSQKT